MAPGQDILAAVSPVGTGGRDFDLFSGTSMATPHIAGIAALLMQLHPDWSPMMIKSAMMTTGTDSLDLTGATKIFTQGAGQVAPNNARHPGLVYDSNINDWFAFLCGATSAVVPATCSALSAAGYSLDPSDLARLLVEAYSAAHPRARAHPFRADLRRSGQLQPPRARTRLGVRARLQMSFSTFAKVRESLRRPEGA
jgi:hypothetical protein